MAVNRGEERYYRSKKRVHLREPTRDGADVTWPNLAAGGASAEFKAWQGVVLLLPRPQPVSEFVSREPSAPGTERQR